MGLLVSGVAHELNNPLQAILGAAGAARAGPGPIARCARRDCASSRRRAAAPAKSSATCPASAASRSGPPSPLDLRDVIAEVVQLRPRDLDSRDRARPGRVGIDCRQVYANFTELEQVTLNFVINAQQAIEAGMRSGAGRILIRLSTAAAKVRLEVHDNGPGVDPGDEPKLFQPFFTTKPVGKGTGLGLSVSYGIIESYGGDDRLFPTTSGAARRSSSSCRPCRDQRPPTSVGSDRQGRAADDRAAVLHDPYSANSTRQWSAFDRTRPSDRRAATVPFASIAPPSIRPPAASRSTPARWAAHRVVDVVDDEDGDVVHVVEGAGRLQSRRGRARRGRLGAALRSHAAAHRAARAVRRASSACSASRPSAFISARTSRRSMSRAR